MTDDLALPAQWSANVYEITYALNSGTNHQDNREWYVYGLGVRELLPPTCSGYFFDGWYLTEDFSTDAPIKDGRMTGFIMDGKGLDRIDLKGLDLRLTWKETELSRSPKAIRQLLDANAGSPTLDMPDAEMTIPQAVAMMTRYLRNVG